MARPLTFSIRDTLYRTLPQRVDRRRLYGWTQIEAIDEQGEPCSVASTDDTGRLILPRGGTGTGLMDEEGRWVERSELHAVDGTGNPLQPIPSRYDAPVELRDKASPTRLLDHDIRDVYLLDEASEGLLQAVGHDIYTFPYNYLPAYEGSPAFVLAGTGEESMRLFLLVGQANRFEPLGLQSDLPEPDEEEALDEALDFAMF